MPFLSQLALAYATTSSQLATVDFLTIFATLPHSWLWLSSTSSHHHHLASLRPHPARLTPAAFFLHPSLASQLASHSCGPPLSHAPMACIGLPSSPYGAVMRGQSPASPSVLLSTTTGPCGYLTLPHTWLRFCYLSSPHLAVGPPPTIAPWANLDYGLTQYCTAEAYRMFFLGWLLVSLCTTISA